MTPSPRWIKLDEQWTIAEMSPDHPLAQYVGWNLFDFMLEEHPELFHPLAEVEGSVLEDLAGP